jgi:4-carboxymuconolactone decarboxylase
MMDARAAETYRQVMAVEPPSGITAAQVAELEHLFGSVWSRPGLSRRERRLVAITCTAFAIEPQPISDHVYAALKTGDLSVDELLEVVLHFAVYCGWPKASHLEMFVRRAWVRVQEERGETPEPLPMRSNDELGNNDWPARIERGAQEFRDVNLVGAPPPDTPYTHAGILNFVFGHVWQRPGLSRRDRRFVTVACVGCDEAPIPISSHVGSALKSHDLTKSEMDELISHFEAYDETTAWNGASRAEALRTAAEATWSEIEASKS